MSTGIEELPGSVRPVPSDAIFFMFPIGLTWFMFGASCFCICCAAFALALPLIEPGHSVLLTALLSAAVLGSFGVLNMRTYARLRCSVAVSPDGIWYLPRRGEPTYIAWCDVASVKAKDTQQRIVLADFSGRRSISLEYQLENYGKLRDFVTAHTSALTHQNVNVANIFHAIWINKIVLLVTALGCLFFAWLIGDNGLPWMSLVFIGNACLILGVIAMDPMWVIIERDSVVVKYPGWERAIPFGSIIGIPFKDVYRHGNVSQYVVITRQNGKPITLRRFREGSVALHNALQAAWTTTGGAKSNSDKAAGALQ